MLGIHEGEPGGPRPGRLWPRWLFLRLLGVGFLTGFLSLAVQIVLMRSLLQNPRAKAPWYNATGVTLYVLGMLVAAFALRTLGVMP